MAGEIEEPFRFNFQADLLHSGSISFGRFESESLSWEKKSSFSHNRYLEEVEKYSKPGAVTEMKAYFEAHFKKKALLKQNSSESQDGAELQTSENDDRQDLQESENGNKSPRSSVHSKYDEETEIKKCEILECHGEELKVCSVPPKDESMIRSTEHLKLKETHQIGTENVVVAESGEITKKPLNDTVVTVDMESQDPCVTIHTANKDVPSAKFKPQPTSSSKVRSASVTKQIQPKQKMQTSISQVQRTISNEAINGSAKSKNKKSEDLIRKEKEKMSPRPATPVTRKMSPRPATPVTGSGRKASNSQESSVSNPKPKLIPQKKSIVKDNRSEKDKTSETKSLVLEKSLLTANRIKQTIKPIVNQSAADFASRSEQRAEKRKEARQALMEKKSAEMKQSQKNLNFKSTPMPARSSDQNKVTSTSNRPRTPCMVPRPTSSFSSTNRTPLPLEEKKKKQKEPQAPRLKSVGVAT